MRLKKRGYSPSIIKEILAYLEENNYLDDRNFYREYIRAALKKGYGRYRIIANLKRWGVAPEAITQALKEEQPDPSRLEELLRKRLIYYRGKKNIGQKLLRYFVNRGFSYEEVMQKLEELGLFSYEDRCFKKAFFRFF